MRLLAQRRQETRHVVGAGDLLLVLDAQEQTQRRIALEFLEAGIDGDVPQGDGQDERAPEDVDGILVAALAPRDPERVQERLIRDRFEQDAEGSQRGGIFESIPGEERLGDGDFHGVRQSSRGGRIQDYPYYAKNPRTVGLVVEKSQKPVGQTEKAVESLRFVG